IWWTGARSQAGSPAHRAHRRCSASASAARRRPRWRCRPATGRSRRHGPGRCRRDRVRRIVGRSTKASAHCPRAPWTALPCALPRPPAIAMPAPMILSDDRIDRLQDLLELRAVPFGGLGLEGLDGFFSALAVGPEEIPEPEWQAVVWGGPAPRWNDDAEAAKVAALLAQARALAVQRACHDGEVLPDRLLPLLWLPEDPEAPPPDALDAGSEWA